MRQYEKYYFRIDNYRYEVDKEMWNKAITGDEVEMYFSPYSKELLEIKIKK